MRHSPSHRQWENAGPLFGIRVDLVRDQIDLVRDQVVLVRDWENPSLLGKPRYNAAVLIPGIKRMTLPWSYPGDMDKPGLGLGRLGLGPSNLDWV